MAEEYNVELTTLAKKQIAQIAQYIITEFHAPETAIKVLDRLETELSKLDKLPERIPLTDIEPWRSRGIRKFVIGHYIAYFLISEPDMTVRITAVVLGKREQRSQLEFMDI